MRQNAPATQREYPLAEHDTLLFSTNFKRRIVDASDALIQASGFGCKEHHGKGFAVVVAQAHTLSRKSEQAQGLEEAASVFHPGGAA